MREFSKGRIVVGPGKDADFQLDDPNVSRRHAAIYWNNGRLMVEDLGSTNGTMVNGYPVTTTPLKQTDVVSIGGQPADGGEQVRRCHRAGRCGQGEDAMLQIVLLAGKFIFLIILYVFLYRVIRSTTRELRACGAPGPWRAERTRRLRPVSAARGSERPSFSAERLRGQPPAAIWAWSWRRALRFGLERPSRCARGAARSAGRSSDMDIYLDDTFVSSKHALFEVDRRRALRWRICSAPMEPQ